MKTFEKLISLSVVMFLSTPGYTAEQPSGHRDPPIVREFQQHPVGYSLIGVGSMLSFIGFTGLFSGGTNPGYHCNQDKNRRVGESNEDCRTRVSEQNAQFYRVMAGVFGTGLLLVGSGGRLILWKNSRSEGSNNISFNIYNKTSIITFTTSLP